MKRGTLANRLAPRQDLGKLRGEVYRCYDGLVLKGSFMTLLDALAFADDHDDEHPFAVKYDVYRVSHFENGTTDMLIRSACGML